jgi:O-antigen/teichoic acid export membrane protein
MDGQEEFPLPPSEPALSAELPPRPTPGTAGAHKRLTLNSASNILRYAFSVAIAFFLTPFVVRTLGDAGYGFWVVLTSFVGYAGILELGVQPAVIKLVAQHRRGQTPEKLAELTSAALLFFSAAGLLAALFVAFALPPLAPRLVKEFHGFGRLGPLFFLIAADVVVLFLNYLFAGILYGWQLYGAKNVIDISAWMVNAAILVAFLARGGLVLLAASKLVTDLLALLATCIFSRRALSGVRPTFRRVPRSAFRELLGFGGKVFVSASTTRISHYAQPLIISSRLSAGATAFFAIPVRITDYAKQIVYALAAGFMPLFSELDAQNDSASIRSFYLRYSRYILTATLPILALIYVYGASFIGMWIGPEYMQRGRYVLYLLTTAALLEGLQPLVWRLFMGIGRLNRMVTVSVVTSLLTVVLGLLFVGPFGITGVALGVLIGVGLAQSIYFWYASRYLQLSVPGLFWKTLGRPLLAGGVCWIVVSAASRLLGQDSYGVLAAGALVSLLLYAPVAFISLHATERQRLLGWLKTRIRRRRGASD